MIPSLSKYQNIFKGFRDPAPYFQSSLYSKTWDEPTYLTFSVFFRLENVDAIYTGYDRFPMPLLNPYIEDNYNIRSQYSTINFLRDTNEFVRAELLNRFIEGLNNLQSYYQWYFQGISGIQNILAVDPMRGQRVASDGKITMTMLEGLDQKMFNLLNLYKKIAWDDTWQRWVLPDMMRYFSMDIYVTEFRSFHIPNIENPSQPNSNVLTTILNLLHGTMPTWRLTCERCEIDITSIHRNMDSYNVANAPDQQTIEFDIKVGQVREEYINPILDYYYTDKLLNGLDRTREFSSGQTQSPQQNTEAAEGNTTINSTRGPNYDPTRVSTNPHAYPDAHILAQGQLLAQDSHIPGTPFYEQANKTNSIQQSFGTVAQPPVGSTFRPDFDPTQPNTWVGNAVNLGSAFVSNFVESAINKGKMTKIPGLGISVNEAISAIESKNFLTVFGLIRQAINRSYELSAPPSSLLDSTIVDGAFRQFLIGVSQSEATTQSAIDLRNYADVALSDGGTFERIKDFSRATDLVSSELREQNQPNPIQNPRGLSNAIDSQTGGDRSLATDLDGGPKDIIQAGSIIEGVPSSQATINRIIKG